MKTCVNVGSSADFKLKRALLIYGESDYNGFPYRHPFVTLHHVIHEDGEVRLGAGQLMAPDSLLALATELGGSLPIEILPQSVLARASGMIAWWSPAQTRPMFFSHRGDDKTLRQLSGKQYPHPPLVFKASGNNLWVRALSQDQRPTATTRLHMAPYWNCYDNGVVCTGTMRIPEQKSADAMGVWEQSFFESAFSHAAGVAKHARYPGGLLALWGFLHGKRRFPAKYLCPIDQTLEQFVTDHDTTYRNQARNQP